MCSSSRPPRARSDENGLRSDEEGQGDGGCQCGLHETQRQAPEDGAARSLDKMRSEGRDVKTTSGHGAHACHRVLVSAGGDARPPAMQTTTGGAETSSVMGMLAGLSVASGVGRRRRPAYGRNSCVVGSVRDDRFRDDMVRQARKSVGASEFCQCYGYGSGEYSDRRSRCRDVRECTSQRDGGLRLSAVGSQHGQGDKMGHSDGLAWAVVMVLCENSVGASECPLMEKGLR